MAAPFPKDRNALGTFAFTGTPGVFLLAGSQMKPQKPGVRYGVGELFGFDFSSLPASEIRRLASAKHDEIRCPFKIERVHGARQMCSKAGGVCSLRQFRKEQNGKIFCEGSPITTCPIRFYDEGMILGWIGEVLLGNPSPQMVTEVPFLLSFSQGSKNPKPVGKIDGILVGAEKPMLSWCAVETQAVYFSGDEMESDFELLRNWQGPDLPFPVGRRRPDFRSSGPKRLMPQLQTKVPTLRRWGKKMAVVVDAGFWNQLTGMREVDDLSNSEIIWFVVSYSNPGHGRFRLQPDSIHYTTLDYAVERLTGGTPMSLERFENEIRARMLRS